MPAAATPEREAETASPPSGTPGPGTPGSESHQTPERLSEASTPPSSLRLRRNKVPPPTVCVPPTPSFMGEIQTADTSKKSQLSPDLTVSGESSSSSSESVKTLPKFRAFPALFVYPNIVSVAFALLASGLVAASTALLISDPFAPESYATRLGLAVAILVLVVVYLAVSFAILIRFKLLQAEWQPYDEPAEPEAVGDPLFKLISKALRRCCRCCGGPKPFDRAKGKFVKPEEEQQEPERTERLLAHPFTLRNKHASDTVEGNSVLWLAKATGRTWSGVLMQPSLMAVQVSLQALAGVGPALGLGSLEALVQSSVICGLQLMFALLVFLFRPGNDRFENTVIACQFLLEGIGTLALVLAGLPLYNLQTAIRTNQANLTAINITALEERVEENEDTAYMMQEASFYLALVALGLPVFMKMYDLFVVIPSKCCWANGKRRSMKEVCISCCVFVATLPSVILVFLGLESPTLEADGGDDMAIDVGEALGDAAEEKLPDDDQAKKKPKGLRTRGRQRGGRLIGMRARYPPPREPWKPPADGVEEAEGEGRCADEEEAVEADAVLLSEVEAAERLSAREVEVVVESAGGASDGKGASP